LREKKGIYFVVVWSANFIFSDRKLPFLRKKLFKSTWKWSKTLTVVSYNSFQKRKLNYSFFCGVQGSNHGPCIYYALSLPFELSSQGQNWIIVNYPWKFLIISMYFKASSYGGILPWSQDQINNVWTHIKKNPIQNIQSSFFFFYQFPPYY